MAYFFIYYFIFAPLRHFPITHGTLWHMHISITSTKNNVNISKKCSEKFTFDKRGSYQN